MFSSRTVLPKGLGATGLFRAIASALRQQKLIALILTFSLLAGAGVVAARRVIERQARGKSVETAITPPLPPAIASHLVTPVGAVLADISTDSVATVSAAAFGTVPFVAPESIVSAFGTQLTSNQQVVIASDADPNTPGTQLPTELAGTSVEVNGRKAGLFFVSPSQINYVIPAATVPGTASVVVKAGTTSYTGTVQVTRVAPAIFTANANGSGVPAALILRASALTGQQRYEEVKQYDSVQRKYVRKPIDMGPLSDRVFLILYVSGVRQAADDNDDGNLNEKIRVLIGGIDITPTYVAPHSQFVGLEQINVEIPRSLIGQRSLDVAVAALDYGTSNVVDIELVVPPTGGNAPPQVFSFGGTALAGNEFVINGTGFSPSPNEAENHVLIGTLPAQVIAATTTQLTVMAPYGVESSAVKVSTTMGEGKSPQDLSVRTSISGVVENTARVPLEGVVVRVCGASSNCDSPQTRTVLTARDGGFVVPDVEEGTLYVEFDGTNVPSDRPYPKWPTTILADRNRDNRFQRAITLQLPTGSSGTVGGGSLTGDLAGKQSGQNDQAGLPPPVVHGVTIQTGEFQLQFPTGVKVNTPSGATSATLTLTPVENSRTPVQLPYGYYSKSIVQITPFNVKFDPGAKLIFPNTDGFPAGMPLVLYRYDSLAGKFVQDKAAVAVSEDGQHIETAADAIKISSYYFASSLRNTTTATGYVLDSDGKTPLQNAFVRCRGQEFFTDSNGSYLLRYVTAEDKEIITVEVSTQRNGSRVDRVPSVSAPAVVGGLTRMPNVVIPDIKTNRSPTIQDVTGKKQVEAGKTLDVPISITDPDVGQSLTVTVSGPGASFATIAPSQFGNIASAYTLRLSPNPSQGGEYTLTITASDSAGGVAQSNVVVYVTGGNTNPQPTAVSQSVTLNEDAMVAVRLDGSDANGAKLIFKIVSQPANGSLSGDLPNLTYTPGSNFSGTDRFTFLVTNGLLESEVATVTLNVRPVNDAPILTVPEVYTINKGQQVSFAVLAFDPDIGDKLAIGLFGAVPPGVLPPTPVTVNSWQFSWTPTQAGTYTIGFRVTDNGSPALSSDAKEVRITVNDVSLLSVPDAQVVSEGRTLSFDVAVVQNVTGAVTIEAADKPSGATLSNPINNSAQFQWTPGSTQSGVYNVSFKATVAGTPPVTETKQVQITVLDVVRDLAKESASVSIFGAAGRLPLSLSDDGDLLGASLATGDLNGDNVPDLAIGAPGANGLGFDNGKVYVFFGSAKLADSIDLARQKADVEILGEAAGDRFGTSLAIADLNGDGKNDLIIGAPKADGSGLTDAGKVYAVFDDLASGSDSITRLAGLTIIGSQRGEAFGTSVAAGFLHTRPGPAADLIVGAPGFDAPSTAAALLDVGAAYVFFGSSQLTKSIELSKTPASYKVTGTFAGGMAGTKVVVGNFNGDDYADFAISAPSANASGMKLNGAVFLGLGGPAIGGEKNTSQASSLTLFGGRESDLLGSSLAMGDLNGDGRADLILAAIGGDGPENSRQGAGNVYVLYGTATLQGRLPDLTVYGSSAEGDTVPDALGTALAVGDFNDDGIADLAIGAPGADNADPKRDATGAVYVIYGARSGLTGVYDLATKQADWTAWGARSGDNLGIGSIAIGDINASEPGDIILGIPKSSSVNNTRTNAGEVRIVYGIR